MRSKEMARVVMSIGSNYGDRSGNVAMAIEELDVQLRDVKSSGIYETPDIRGGEKRYMNAVVSGEWEGTMEECDRLCKAMELIHGRDAEARKMGNVPLDVDIVIWDGRVIRERDYRQQFFTIGLSQIEDGSYPS